MDLKYNQEYFLYNILGNIFIKCFDYARFTLAILNDFG